MRSIMDVKDKIRFPMSPETFIEIQEYISCKTIDDKDKGILSTAVELMNQQYDNGHIGAPPVFVADVIQSTFADAGAMASFMKPEVQNCAEVISSWCALAYLLGRKRGGYADV